MPGIDQLLGNRVEIQRVSGRDITKQHLLNADALLCRSVTQVDSALLNQTTVKFVGTATIGTDHLDKQWLADNGINWSSAAGCNAGAVAQYVISAICYWCLKLGKEMTSLTVGIVGAGNVGTELARCLSVLGVSYSIFDPPLQAKGDRREFVNFASILACDVISLHVPLTREGEYKTQDLIATDVLSQLASEQLLINSSRGEVINNTDLIHYLNTANSAQVVLDVFENEPNIPFPLLDLCLLTTPHIAGHTLEGKLRGSWMVYRAFCKNFNITVDAQEQNLYPTKKQLKPSNSRLEKQILEMYDVSLDSDSLKAIARDNVAMEFDELRRNAFQLKNGLIRRDYSGWELPTSIKKLAHKS